MPKTRKLSAGRPRTELIASHTYGALADGTPPPTPPKNPAPAADPAPEKNTDVQVDAKIKALGDVIDAMEKSGTADPDELAQLKAAYQDLLDAQAADDKPDPDAAKPDEPADGKTGDEPAVTAAAAPGDVADDAKCANCGHLGSAHQDVDAGKNTGACTMQNCDCQTMTAGSSVDDPGQPGGSMASALVDPIPDAPMPPVPPGPTLTDAADAPELNVPPEMQGSVNMGPAFTIPVAVIEGQPTGDGRQIAPMALTWRVPPVPLMGLATNPHDPMGIDMNAPAVICGRIDSFERIPGDGDTQIIQAKGYYLPNDDGLYFADLTQAFGRCGVSADIAVEEVDMEVGEIDDMGFPIEMSEMLTKGTIMGVTQCPFPAFEGAYIVVGDGSVQPAAIPQADADPEAVTASAPIHWITYEQCEPCDQGLDVVVASGQGPLAPPKVWFSDPGFEPDDGRLVEILDKRGQRVIGGKYACPITVTDEGRVFGHIAPWGVCHTGNAGQCILAPHSKADYAHFKRGQHIITAEGEQIRVGVITADTGHAQTRGITASDAMAHYDNTALAVADVNIGEDEHGIWIAGAIRPDATEAQIRKLRAASISGDWRQLGGNLELVAALAVNQPGFPLAVIASGHHEALVAAGGQVMAKLKTPTAVDDSPGAIALRTMRAEKRLQNFAADSDRKAERRIAALR